MSGRRRYLAAYDIRDDRRLRRVHSVMKAYGWPMQYSVFICDLDAIELLNLKTDIAAEIHHAQDSVAIIDLGDPRDRGRESLLVPWSRPDASGGRAGHPVMRALERPRLHRSALDCL